MARRATDPAMAPLALFGGSGRTGQRVLEEAARRGLPVRGMVRRPGSLEGPGSVLEVVGRIDSVPDLDRALDGCSAVCAVFGPRQPVFDVFCTEATRAILEGMRRHGIRRIVCVTGAMIGSYRHNRSWPFRRVTGVYQRRQPGPHEDRVGQEKLLQSSDLDWTLIKPPRLIDTPGTRELQVGPDVRVGLRSAVSRLDLAELLLDELFEPRFARQTVFVAG